MDKGLSKEGKKKFQVVQSLSKEGKLVEATQILQGIVEDNPESGILAASLANSYWDLEEYSKAEEYFKKAIVLTPDSEKISLGYFHFLWEQDKQVEALDEAKRFLELTPSEEYNNLIESIRFQE